MGFFDLFKSKKIKDKKTILNLEVNDIVEYDLTEYEVIGKIRYNEGGYTWYDYHLLDNQESFWLYAEQDDRIRLGLFKKIDPNHKLYSQFANNYPSTITYGDQNFNLVEKGKATIKIKGQVGAKSGQRMEYADYKTNDQMISVEKWGSELEISIGENINKNLIEIYPAKGE